MEHNPDILLPLPISSAVPIVAVGAELKGSICLLQGGNATVSPGTGPLTDAAAYRSFRNRLDRIRRGLADETFTVAHDLHPASLATQAAHRYGKSRIGVQHHHAHTVACMMENGVADPVIGICCDGTGYGTDGAVWGGEVLAATSTAFTRHAHLQYFRLPGGDAAARDTWRPALSLVQQSFGNDVPPRIAGLFDRVDRGQLATVEAMLRSGFNCPTSSSLGRLFDAVAFLIGCCDRNETEGQAAIQLERTATTTEMEPYPFRIAGEGSDGEIILDALIAAISEDVCRLVPREMIAGRFHETVARMFCEAATQAAERESLDTIALSGGCFFNQILKRRVSELLLKQGMRRILVHNKLSPGDDGLSLGQAAVAAARVGSPTSCA